MSKDLLSHYWHKYLMHIEKQIWNPHYFSFSCYTCILFLFYPFSIISNHIVIHFISIECYAASMHKLSFIFFIHQHIGSGGSVIASFQQTLWTVVPMSAGAVRQKAMGGFVLSTPWWVCIKYTMMANSHKQIPTFTSNLLTAKIITFSFIR